MATAFKLPTEDRSEHRLVGAIPDFASTLAAGLQSISSFTTERPPEGDGDAQIIEAFERIRAHRAYDYSFDDAPSARPKGEIAASEEARLADEQMIWSTSAKTVDGVICRLMLLIPDLDSNRWVDRTLMTDGINALEERLNELDGNAQHVVRAIGDLMRLSSEPVGLHTRWLAEYQAARGYVDDLNNPEDTAEYAAAAASIGKIERLALARPAETAHDAIAKMFILARMVADGDTLRQQDAGALVLEATELLGLAARTPKSAAAPTPVALAFDSWAVARLASEVAPWPDNDDAPNPFYDAHIAAEKILAATPACSAEDVLLKLFPLAMIEHGPGAYDGPFELRYDPHSIEKPFLEELSWQGLIEDLKALSPKVTRLTNMAPVRVRPAYAGAPA